MNNNTKVGLASAGDAPSHSGMRSGDDSVLTFEFGDRRLAWDGSVPAAHSANPPPDDGVKDSGIALTLTLGVRPTSSRKYSPGLRAHIGDQSHRDRPVDTSPTGLSSTQIFSAMPASCVEARGG